MPLTSAAYAGQEFVMRSTPLSPACQCSVPRDSGYAMAGLP